MSRNDGERRRKKLEIECYFPWVKVQSFQKGMSNSREDETEEGRSHCYVAITGIHLFGRREYKNKKKEPFFPTYFVKSKE